LPKSNAIQNEIQKVGQDAVVAFLGISVMARMMTRRLEKANAVEEIDNDSVLRRRAMSPFVKLICVGTQDYKQPDLPCQQSTSPRDSQNDAAETDQVPRASKPIVASEVARVMMMKNIGFGDKSPGDGPILVAVGIFKPMNKSRYKVCKQNR